MMLLDLSPRLMRHITQNGEPYMVPCDAPGDAEALVFSCPACAGFANLLRRHEIVCWSTTALPEASQETPVRWHLSGQSLGDITVDGVDGPAAIEATCGWQGFVTNGTVNAL